MVFFTVYTKKFGLITSVALLLIQIKKKLLRKHEIPVYRTGPPKKFTSPRLGFPCILARDVILSPLEFLNLGESDTARVRANSTHSIQIFIYFGILMHTTEGSSFENNGRILHILSSGQILIKGAVLFHFRYVICVVLNQFWRFYMGDTLI